MKLHLLNFSESSPLMKEALCDTIHENIEKKAEEIFKNSSEDKM